MRFALTIMTYEHFKSFEALRRILTFYNRNQKKKIFQIKYRPIIATFGGIIMRKDRKQHSILPFRLIAERKTSLRIAKSIRPSCQCVAYEFRD